MNELAIWRPRRNTITQMDALQFAWQIEPRTVQTVITSPPYFGLRDYGVPGQWGSEPTIQAHIDRIVELFRAIREALRDDGTVWLNYGDSYSRSAGDDSTKKTDGGIKTGRTGRSEQLFQPGNNRPPDGLKPKDLIGMPWRVALALQADGWWLRSDIIWHKCLSGGTHVYAKTKKGEMPTTIKDLVRLDPSTVKLWNGQKWTQCVSFIPADADPDRRSKGQMVRHARHLGKEMPVLSDLELILRSGERIGCKRTHRWPTQRGLVEAADLQVGDVLDATCLPEPDNPLNPEFVPDEIGWFVGLFIAEGSYGKGGNLIQIASHVKEEQRYRRLSEIVRKYGGSIKWHKTGGKASTMNIYSNVLIGILQDYLFGDTAKKKHLTSRCWQRSNRFLDCLLRGYLEGDGHSRGNGSYRLGFTLNDAWAADLRTICARLGYSLRLVHVKHMLNGVGYPGYRGEVFLEGNHRRVDTEITDIKQSRARQFWDIAVADEPHLFALASGVLTHNSNPMPESVTDRPTKAHEYIFLLAKSERYYYDADAIREPASDASIKRLGRGVSENHKNANGAPGQTPHTLAKPRPNINKQDALGKRQYTGFNERYEESPNGLANKRTVWTIPTQPFPGAHFAVFPEALIKPCVLAGAPKGGLVYDPFMGAGTTAVVAKSHGRDFIGSEINPEYIQLANARLDGSIKRLVAEKNALPLEDLPLFKELNRED